MSLSAAQAFLGGLDAALASEDAKNAVDGVFDHTESSFREPIAKDLLPTCLSVVGLLLRGLRSERISAAESRVYAHALVRTMWLVRRCLGDGERARLHRDLRSFVPILQSCVSRTQACGMPLIRTSILPSRQSHARYVH